MSKRTAPKVAWDQAKSEVIKMKLEAILTEAAMLFTQKGYSATSLDDVSGQLQITKTALYHYVKNKNELLYLCYLRSLERTEDCYKAADAEGKTGLEKVISYLRHDAKSGLIAMTPLTELNAIVDQTRKKDLAKRLDKCEKKFISFIKQGIADGSISAGDPEEISHFILSASRDILKWYDPHSDDPISELVERFITLFTQGLIPRK